MSNLTPVIRDGFSGMNLAQDWDGMATAMSGDADHGIWNMTSTVENNDWVLYVDAVMLSLTILGALSMIGTMAWLEYKGRPSTTRTRIVQSLVLSDFVLGVTGLISVSLALSPEKLKAGQACDGLGTLLVAVLWTEHLWTLTLAVATFMILIYPLHTLTLWLEKRWYLLWIGVWTVSFGVAVLGYELYGYVPNGGICYYPSSSGLYGELMQFIPRGMVFVVISILYARLFVFLRRPDKIRSPYYDDSSVGETSGMPTTFFGFRTRRISSLFRKGKPTQNDLRIDIPKQQPIDVNASYEAHDVANGAISPLSAATPITEIPPWERMELPVFQVDGQRFGGASANQPNISSNPWGNWKGLGTGKVQDSRKRPSTPSSQSPLMPTSRTFGSGSTQGDIRELPRMISPKLETIPSMMDAPTINTPDDHPPSSRRSTLTGPHHPRKPSTLSEAGPLTPQPSMSHLSEGYDPDIRRGSAVSATQSTRRSSATPTVKECEVIHPSPSERNSIDLRRHRTAEEEEDDNWDLMRILQQSAPVRSRHERDQGETVELVEESMASYLNRKTALLMLWFPLGYCLLFSVSLVRIIYDFVGTPPVALRAVSRWFIFAQGLLDALIYGLVEWHTKRVVRKRVRRGTFSPSASRSNSNPGTGIASAFRALGSRNTRRSNADTVQGQRSMNDNEGFAGSQTNTRRGNTVSFGRIMEIEDPRSIHQALENEGNENGINLGYLSEKRGSSTPSYDTRDTNVSSSSGLGSGTRVDA